MGVFHPSLVTHDPLNTVDPKTTFAALGALLAILRVQSVSPWCNSRPAFTLTVNSDPSSTVLHIYIYILCTAFRDENLT